MIELSPFRSSGIGVHNQARRDAVDEPLSGSQRFIASTFQAIYNFLKQASAVWKVLALVLDIVTFLMLVWAIDHPVLICVLPISLGLVPLGVMALWTVIIGAHLDEPHLLISADVVQRGDELRVMYRQRVFKDIQFTYMAVQLVMREWVRYTDGTDTSTAHHDTLYQEKVYDSALRLAADETLERRVVFAMPPDAMHTFIAADNKLHWLIKVRLEMVGRGVYQEEFEVQVLPVTNVTGESVA